MSQDIKALAPITSEKFDAKEIDLLRKTYADGLDDTQLRVFLKQCESMDLNPFTKEIYGMVIAKRLVLITSIGGLRKMAHQSGDYAGCTVTVTMDGEKPKSARAVVKKIVQGNLCEFESEVLFKEYNTGQNNWAKMPVTMIKKVAEAAALRMAFPSVENLYEEGEVGSMQRKKGQSVESQHLTEKFKAQEARDVTVYPENTADVEKPGDNVDKSLINDYVVPIGKNTGKKMVELTDKEVGDFVAWAYGQNELTPKAKEYLNMAETYLESKATK